MKKVILYTFILLLAVMLCACEEENKPEKVVTPVETSTAVQKQEEKKEEIVEVESGEENIIVEEKEETENKTNSEYTTIRFSDMYETKGKIKNVSATLKNLNGKKVSIKGYPAVQSPLDESFIYLNNQPFVTCPFCTIGDTTKLEVIPIFMANGSKIKYTENAIIAYGKLEVLEKVDSEGYTTQFRVYADKVEELKDDGADKAVNDYYLTLSQQGMIYDIQTLQMNVEYATSLEYMKYYDEKLSTGKSTKMDKVAVAKAIAEEYVGYDSEYGDGFGTERTYLVYIKECPDIVKMCEPKEERLKKLNDELITLYNDEIKILEKYQNICYKIYALKDNLTEKQADGFIKELNSLNAGNLKQYDAFTAWNNKLRG